MILTPADLDLAIEVLQEAKYKISLSRTADTVRALAEAEALAADVRRQLGLQNIAEAVRILGATIVETKRLRK